MQRSNRQLCVQHGKPSGVLPGPLQIALPHPLVVVSLLSLETPFRFFKVLYAVPRAGPLKTYRYRTVKQHGHIGEQPSQKISMAAVNGCKVDTTGFISMAGYNRRISSNHIGQIVKVRFDVVAAKFVATAVDGTELRRFTLPVISREYILGLPEPEGVYN